jgi:hypothetical protein
VAEVMALNRETFRSMGRFWRPLKWPSRVCLVLTVALFVIWIMSYGNGYFATTDSQLDTFMLYHGDVVWKHRSAAGADLSTSTGRWYGLRLPFYLGEAIKIPTRGGQHLWYTDVPLWLIVVVAAVLTATLMRRDYRKDRAAGFPVGPAGPPSKVA